MTVMPAPQHHQEPYTADEVLSWPADGIRHEVFDGNLHVSPYANIDHEVLLSNLRKQLGPLLPPGWLMVGPVNLRIDAATLMVPDLVLLDRRPPRGALAAEPARVRLVVEVVSPSSRTMDRTVKPAKYAAAGIEHFWLFDNLDKPGGPVLREHQLMAGGIYDAGATWRAGRRAEILVPVEASFDPADLLR